MADAESEQKSLGTDLLNGAILADRYLGPFHHSTAAELETWLREYSDEPETEAIRALLRRRLPRGAAMPPGDPPPALAPANTPDVDPAEPAAAPPIAIDGALRDDVARDLEAQKYDGALRLIARLAHGSPAASAALRAEVARALFVANKDEAALKLAADSWTSTPAKDRCGRAALVAGLASWRLGRVSAAASWFKRAAKADDAPADLRAAGAFWAARTALRDHDAVGYQEWLKRAGAERRTFYGLIARRMLGWGTGLILGRDLLSQADIDALAAMPGGLRAFALLQIGQPARAEQELRALWPKISSSAPLRRALLLVAANAGLTDLAAQLAALVQAADGVPHDALLFPVPRLTPAGGFIVDPALVYGLTRTESNFRPDAVSPQGARGLMQIMPITARAVGHIPRITDALLRNPSENLGLGQRVLLALAKSPGVSDDLIRLLAAYNDGPAGLASWDRDIRDQGDPLLYIEAIPVPQTRRFVQRVLANTWIYAARLGLPAPSLDDLAGNRRPLLSPELEAPDAEMRTALRMASLTTLR